MQDRKLWHMIALLSEDERLLWLDFLAYQLGHKQVFQQAAAAFLVKSFPAPPSETEVWQVLYPNQPYDDARLRKVLGDLTAYLEAFFSSLATASSPLDQRVMLLRRLLPQADPILFGQTWRKACKDVFKFASSASELAKYRMELEVLNREFRLQHRMKEGAFWIPPQEIAFGELGMLQRIAFLDTAWNLYKVLELVANAENEARRQQHRPEIPLEKAFLDLARHDTRFRNLPLVAVYLRILDLLQQKQTQVASLLRYLYRHYAAIPKVERDLLFASLLNHLVRELNRSEAGDTLHDLIRLYDWGIQTGQILYDGVLVPAHYKNFFKLCLRSGELDRAREFLRTGQALLPKEARQELYALHSIYLAFAEKDFNRTVKIASHSTFSQVLDEIDARTLLLQAHYELKSWEEEWLEGQLSRLMRFVRQQKELPPYTRKNVTGQLMLFMRLVRSQTRLDHEKVASSLPEPTGLETGLPGWIREKVKEKMSG